MSLSTSRFFLRTAFKHQSLRTTIHKPLYNQFSRGFQSTVANMGVHNIASKAELQTVLDGSVDPNNTEIKPIVVLDAFATWCGPCKVIAPTIAAWSENAYKHVHFVKVDVDEVPDVAQELGIRAMPTFVIFKDGKPVKEVVGANPKALENWIKEFAGEGTKAE